MKLKILFIIPLLLSVLSCSDLGESVENNKGLVYYKEPVTKALAENLAGFLVKIKYFNGNSKSVQILQEGSIYTVKFAADDDSTLNTQTEMKFRRLSPLLSYAVFHEALVNIEICDKEMNVIKSMPGFNYGKRLRFGSDELYINESVNLELANAIGSFLQQTGFFQNNGLRAQLTIEDKILQFKFVARKSIEFDENYITAVREYGKLISEKVLNNEKINIHVCDEFFETILTVYTK
jgi:hypothetical protein